MDILRKKLSKKEFSEYVKTKDFGKLAPTSIVIHHTWRPTLDSWEGGETIDALQRNYEAKGWNAGPHIFVGPDGIWLFTDMNEIGIHAGSGNGVWKKSGKLIYGYSVPGGTLQSYSIGLEVVGNYDDQVWEGEVKKNALHCISELQKTLELDDNALKFHREFSQKSCPGTMITKAWLEAELQAYRGERLETVDDEAQQAVTLGLMDSIENKSEAKMAKGLVRLWERVKERLT